MRPYETELRAAEARVAEGRVALRLASNEWVRHKRDVATSGKGLLSAAALGFTVGGVLRARPKKAAAAASKGGFLTLLTGVAAALFRARYGDPWTAASKFLLHRGTAGLNTGPRDGVRPSYRP